MVVSSSSNGIPQGQAAYTAETGLGAVFDGAPSIKDMLVQECPASEPDIMESIPRYPVLMRVAIVVVSSMTTWGALWWLIFGRR